MKQKYNLNFYYRFIYFILVGMLFPFIIISIYSKIENYVIPIFIISLMFFSNEIYFVFSREVQKLYEKILYRTFVEKIRTIIQAVLIISVPTLEIYYFFQKSMILFLICISVILLWYLIQRWAVSIGDKSIIIGREVFSYEEVNNIVIEGHSIVIEAEDIYKKYYYRIPNQDIEEVKELLDELI